jgi:hypothetical protein
MSTITIKTDNPTLINILIGACSSVSGTQIKVKADRRTGTHKVEVFDDVRPNTSSAVADMHDAYKDSEEMGENELLLIAEIKKRVKENRLGESMTIEEMFKELAND